MILLHVIRPLIAPQRAEFPSPFQYSVRYPRLADQLGQNCKQRESPGHSNPWLPPSKPEQLPPSAEDRSGAHGCSARPRNTSPIGFGRKLGGDGTQLNKKAPVADSDIPPALKPGGGSSNAILRLDSKPTNLTFHPLATLFPVLDGDEAKQLKGHRSTRPAVSHRVISRSNSRWSQSV